MQVNAPLAVPGSLPAAHLLSLQHPLWMCAMRSFFLLTMGSAVLLVGLWSAVLALGLPPPPVAGGALVWHAHELLLGFGLAAVAGFVLTAVPEFTATAGATPRAARWLVALWLLGRVGFWLSGVAGLHALAVSGAAQLGLLGLLIALLWPAWRTAAGQRHRAFGWALAGMVLLMAGFYGDALRGAYAMRWLHALVGLLMVLTIVAMSRISMRIVNRAIDDAGTGAAPYLARPPRRNLAVLCIALFTVAEFTAAGSRTSGWLACASAAALFNLMGDWHVGRPLLRRWPLTLYTVYLCMAMGYALMGWALLTGGLGVAAGRHLLTVGAMGMAIYAVICIDGRAHCGLPVDRRAWSTWGTGLIVMAALLRVGAVWAGEGAIACMTAAGLCWIVAFGLLCFFIAPVLWRARADNLWGCQG